MRRVSVHALFAGVTLACVAIASYDAVRLVQARRINEQVAALSVNAAVYALSPASNAPRVSTAERTENAAPVAVDPGGGSAPEHDTPRAVRLAHAVALSAAQRYAAAGPSFDALIDSGPSDVIGRAALFDLANMYLAGRGRGVRRHGSLAADDRAGEGALPRGAACRSRRLGRPLQP